MRTNRTRWSLRKNGLESKQEMTAVAEPFRRATSDDATDLAELVNIAGNGLALYLWSKLVQPGQSGWDVGRERAGRGVGGFAYSNTVIRENSGKTAACLIGYPLGASPEPPADDTLPILQPLLELETKVPNTWYVNVLATYPEFRGNGLGSELLGIAERLADETDCSGLSLIVADANTSARRLYERHGYVERASRAMVKEDWTGAGQKWVLLVKDS